MGRDNGGDDDGDGDDGGCGDCDGDALWYSLLPCDGDDAGAGDDDDMTVVVLVVLV